MPQHAPGLGRPRTVARLAAPAALAVMAALTTSACTSTPAPPTGQQPLALRSASPGGSVPAQATATGPADACALLPAADLAALGITAPGVGADLGTSPDHTLTCVWAPTTPTAPALSLTVTVPQDAAGRQRAAAEKRQAATPADGLTAVPGVGDAAVLSREAADITVLQFWRGTTQATLTCTHAPATALPALTTAAAHIAARL